jgi:predicted nucleic acid-binding protein
MQYKQYIEMYKLRYTNLYLIPIKNLVNKIYKKKIVFNIINLKNYFLDSNIITNIIASKARKRKNKISTVLTAALTRVRTPVLSKNLITREKKKLIIKNDYFLFKNKELSDSNNNIDKLLLTMYNNKNDLDQEILKSTKNKLVTGIRLRASGRLTRRFTAERSVSKLKYLGTTKNVNSSYKGFSSKLLKNNLRSNLQFTEIKSKNRVGAFGIKG